MERLETKAQIESLEDNIRRELESEFEQREEELKLRYESLLSTPTQQTLD